ncbi:MAG: RNA polymerase sigma-70 factor [Cyclobacteriaceae bacterium]
MIFDKQDILIEKIRAGDTKALRQLYDAYFLRVVNFAYKLLHNKEDACEVAQDVFVKIWDIRKGLDEHKSVSGLIFRITKFKSIDLLRKAENRVGILGIEPSNNFFVNEQTAEQGLFAKELEEEYERALEGLPDKRRRIFRMSREDNLTYKQIADKLDISPKTVEAQIRLALQQIREGLAHHRDDILYILLAVTPAL